MQERLQPRLGDELFGTPLGERLDDRVLSPEQMVEARKFVLESEQGAGAQLLLPGMPTSARDREARALAFKYVESKNSK